MREKFLYMLLAGLAACSREGAGVSLLEENRKIEFSAAVSRAAQGTEEERTPGTYDYAPLVYESGKFDMLTGDPFYGDIHIYHVQDLSRDNGSGEYVLHRVQNGELVPADNSSSWYWLSGVTEAKHLFHAWTMPTDSKKWASGENPEDSNPIVGFFDYQAQHNNGWVDMSMDTKYTDYVNNDEPKGEVREIRYSNLEFFIGAVRGPIKFSEADGVSCESNGKNTVVSLLFRHMVSKILVREIQHIKPDGTKELLNAGTAIDFIMPNMPETAFWTTGVGEGEGDLSTAWDNQVLPHLLPLDDEAYQSSTWEKDGKPFTVKYGVPGKVESGSSFYICPCKFDAKSSDGVGTVGDIEFKYNDRWYYGSLKSLTGLGELKAGECISLILQLKDGSIAGLYPHIVGWTEGTGSSQQHDMPGIYSQSDWKKYVDWMNDYIQMPEGSKPAPPAGLFDEDGNLNLYCDLDLAGYDEEKSQSSATPTLLDLKYSQLDSLLFWKDGELVSAGKLYGNGYEVKTPMPWDSLKGAINEPDNSDEITITYSPRSS